MRKYLGAAACLVVLSFLLIHTPASAAGADLVIAVQKNPATLEPLRENSNMAMRVVYNVFDTLLEYEYPSFKIVPSLATEWKRIDDKTLEFKLRQGVKFHNGDEFNAKDVLFTFGAERMYDKQKPGYGNAVMFFGGIDKIEAIDDFTVRVTAKKSDPVLEHRFASYMGQILSKKDFEQAGDYNKFSVAPAGTGPYRIVENKVDEFIKLTAFKDSWRGQPEAKNVSFQVVNEVSARVAGLVSGEFGIITELPPDQFKTIESKSNLEVVGGPIRNNRVLIYDESDPVMADPMLRRALNAAIDRDLIVKSLYRGMTSVPNGNQFTYYRDMYLADWSGEKYDPKLAKEYLAKSKYKGQEIVYRLLPGYYTFQAATAEIMQAMWKAVGINVKLVFVENWGQVLDTKNGRQIFDYSSTMMYPDPVGHLWRLWGKNGVFQTRKAWFNEEFNQLGAVLESSSDLEERRKIFRRMMEIYQIEDPSGTYLHQLAMFYGKNKNIDWKPDVVEYMNLRPGGLKFK